MQFLFMRRICEMIILTIIPSLIASSLIQLDEVQGAIFYPVLAIISVVCTVIFFGGNLLMMRRMTRDIKSKKIYMIVQYTTYAIYAGIIALICVFTWDSTETMFWKDARVAFFFHSRVFEVICDPIVIDPDDLTKNLISPCVSMIISTALFGVVTLFSHPFFTKRYIIEQNKIKKAKAEGKNLSESEMDKYAVSIKKSLDEEIDQSDENSEGDADDKNRLYSIKELRKMDNESAMATTVRKKRINWSAWRVSAHRGNDIKMREIVKDAILNFGSYGFYQNLIEKQQNGEYIGKYVRRYVKGKFSIHKRNIDLK